MLPASQKLYCPYHAHFSGKIERANTLKSKLAKLSEDKKLPGPKLVPLTLIANVDYDLCVCHRQTKEIRNYTPVLSSTLLQENIVQ